MSDYSPTSSSYETAANSPSETLYNIENRIRFSPRGTNSATTDGIVILDLHNIQQWQMDMALARTEGITNQLEARLHKATLELDREVAHLHYEMDAILRLRK
ncbi:hypothetical protein FACUT_6124 [Fusarium acutatum]|uniref:Tektin n=1 Tax=Fusarium acutatum TaxID=78861 RepID=A0A8H4JQ17_9HYPO|nr:hypothetical protein FACUT_6124 [Fusarium acutatum]